MGRRYDKDELTDIFRACGATAGEEVSMMIGETDAEVSLNDFVDAMVDSGFIAIIKETGADLFKKQWALRRLHELVGDRGVAYMGDMERFMVVAQGETREDRQADAQDIAALVSERLPMVSVVLMLEEPQEGEPIRTEDVGAMVVAGVGQVHGVEAFSSDDPAEANRIAVDGMTQALDRAFGPGPHDIIGEDPRTGRRLFRCPSDRIGEHLSDASIAGLRIATPADDVDPAASRSAVDEILAMIESDPQALMAALQAADRGKNLHLDIGGGIRVVAGPSGTLDEEVDMAIEAIDRLRAERPSPDGSDHYLLIRDGKVEAKAPYALLRDAIKEHPRCIMQRVPVKMFIQAQLGDPFRRSPLA